MFFYWRARNAYWEENISDRIMLLKGLCHELRGYSVITNLSLKIRSNVKKPLLIKRVNIGHSWPSSSFSFPT